MRRDTLVVIEDGTGAKVWAFNTTAVQQVDPIAAAEQCLLWLGRPRGGRKGQGMGRFDGGERWDGGQGHRQAGVSSATSGRWSDIRAHAVPRGTKVDTHRRPRT